MLFFLRLGLSFLAMTKISILFFIIVYFMIVSYKKYDKVKDHFSLCNKGEDLFISLRLIRNEIMKINNYSIIKSIQYIKDEFKYMEINTSNMSNNNLNTQKNMIINMVLCNKLIPVFTTEQINNYQNHIASIKSLKQQYNFTIFYSEVFFYRHGLIYFNDKLLNYMINKDIIDIGAWIGDSMLILENYTNKVIYSYEISEYNIKKLYSTLYSNHLNYSKHVIIQKGISNYNGVEYITNSGSAGVGINNKGYLKVNITTIDDEVIKNRIDVGFIKADVEGTALELIKGAKNTILKKHPILSISIYHNYIEYFEIRKYLNSLTSSYSYDYILGNLCKPYACEFSLIAYPNYI